MAPHNRTKQEIIIKGKNKTWLKGHMPNDRLEFFYTVGEGDGFEIFIYSLLFKVQYVNQV